MDDLSLKEQDKYRRMWAVNAYRERSPGQRTLPDFAENLTPGVRIGDFGVGCGRAAQELKNRGFDVIGIDITRDCLDPDVEIDFLEASLWDLPGWLQVDIGYCTDVMEHIPTEKVHDTLQSIKGACTTGCFFQIATFRDSFGRRIGETLHLTVQDTAWWEEQMKAVWQTVTVLNAGRDARFWVS